MHNDFAKACLNIRCISWTNGYNCCSVCKTFSSTTWRTEKKKMKEWAISSNHEEEEEGIYSGGLLLLSLSQTCFKWTNSHFPSSLWSWQMWSYLDNVDLKPNCFYSKWGMKPIIKKHDVRSTSWHFIFPAESFWMPELTARHSGRLEMQN